jgi:serine/threonine protein kinase
MTIVKQLSGKIFGNYTLSNYLGYSGIAYVYKSTLPETDEEIAIQLLPNHFIDQPGFADTFIYKANPLKELRHSNIIPVLDCGVDNGFPYLVTRHFEGPTLQDLMDASKKRTVRIPLEACLFIIHSLGAALSHAHKIGIPHGNLQPTNILLEKSGIVMIGDFRLYRIMIYKPQLHPGEMDKPEASKASIMEDKHLDLSALGHIFYQIVTGKPPYESSSTLLFRRDKLHQILRPPSELVPDIPKLLEKVIEKALAHTPEDRYQNIDELIQDLHNTKRGAHTSMLPYGDLLELAQSSGRYKESVTPETLEKGKAENPALFFPDNGHYLELDQEQDYTIGRKNQGQPIVPDINLTPFKGYEWGISRMHASLKVSSDGVTITDLTSSNGTWYSGQRIPPNKPFDLKHKDTFMLGRMRVQVLLPE